MPVLPFHTPWKHFKYSGKGSINLKYVKYSTVIYANSYIAIRCNFLGRKTARFETVNICLEDLGLGLFDKINTQGANTCSRSIIITLFCWPRTGVHSSSATFYFPMIYFICWRGLALFTLAIIWDAFIFKWKFFLIWTSRCSIWSNTLFLRFLTFLFIVYIALVFFSYMLRFICHLHSQNKSFLFYLVNSKTFLSGKIYL